MSDFEWRAGCPACGATLKRSYDHTWMKKFFLPSHCHKCGLRGKDNWIVELGRFEYRGKLLLPWTWRVVWQPVEQSDDQ